MSDQNNQNIEFIMYQLGEEIQNLLKQENITEIMLNQDSYLWIERAGKGTEKTDFIIREEQAKTIINTIASYNKKELSIDSSIISGILPTGDRFEGLTGEITGNKTIFSIRKRATRIITFEEYIEMGFLSIKQKKYLEKAVLEKKNILVVGGTSSGKTTFTNACLNVLKTTNDRIIMLEDTDELQCPAPNKVKLKSTIEITSQFLLQSSMRMNGDRMIVGELRRGLEAEELLKAWNSGHSGGISTIHADNAVGGLQKLEQYLMEVRSDNLLSLSILIGTTVNVVVSIIKENNKRYVREIKEVHGYDIQEKKYIMKDFDEEWKSKFTNGYNIQEEKYVFK